MGSLLSEMLVQALGSHPNVGDIRGRGLFWGIELVADKAGAVPFPVGEHVAMDIAELGLTEKYGIAVYPGSGTVDGVNGDHVILAPPYNVTKEDVKFMAETMAKLITDYFSAKLGAAS